MDIIAALKHAFSAGSYVDLAVPEGSHSGFVVGLSDDLVLLQAVHEWNDAGALVVPVDRVESVGISERHDDQIRILAFNSVKRTQRYKGVKLTSMAALFRSVMAKGRFIVLSFEDEAEVGLIEDVGEDSVDLKAVDPGGNWTGDTLECAFDDITAVQFDDNYSRVLQRFIERTPALN